LTSSRITNGEESREDTTGVLHKGSQKKDHQGTPPAGGR
jgi:hypothetical protein